MSEQSDAEEAVERLRAAGIRLSAGVPLCGLCRRPIPEMATHGSLFGMAVCVDAVICDECDKELQP